VWVRLAGECGDGGGDLLETGSHVGRGGSGVVAAVAVAAGDSVAEVLLVRAFF
jgi:hypothetical protein